jgi:hypothetical protein
MADLPAPKPFYCSRLFWLGLPGLMFLLWLWLVFSPKGIYLEAGHWSYEVLSFRSALEVTASVDRGGPNSWEVEVGPLEEEDRVDPGDHLLKRDYKVWAGESAAGGARPRFAFFRQDYLSMRPWLWGWADRKPPSSLSAERGDNRLRVTKAVGTLRVAWETRGARRTLLVPSPALEIGAAR